MSAENPPMIATDGTLLDKMALGRQQLWEEIGMPISPNYMTEQVMDRDYRGRFSCVNRDVLKEAQRALKFVACPNCVIEQPHGVISVTRFWIGVQDDVMTVFKAMARCFCYNCAHEEYWPLSRDPRTRAQDEERYAYEKEMMMRAKQAINPAMGIGGAGGAGGVLGSGMGVAGIGAGLLGGGMAAGGGMNQARSPKSSPFIGMTPDEMQALQRVYADSIKNQPPAQQQGLMDAIRKRMGI